MAKSPKQPQHDLAAYVLLDPKKLRSSPTNPRRSFDQLALEELVESVRVRGIDVPLRVRPLADPGSKGPTHEVIAGHRRLKAALTAGLKQVPCHIEELADQDAAVAAYIDNDQRENITPIDQATALHSLLTDHHLTVEQISEQIGKPPRKIRELLALLRLPDIAQAAVNAGRLSTLTAGHIVRIPDPEQRLEAAVRILSNGQATCAADYDPLTKAEPLPQNEARALIHELYIRQLKGCPFSTTDKELLPEAGSCKACPKRAGNAQKADPDTYAGLRGDMCLDVACYRRKVAAHWQHQEEAARAAGMLVLPQERQHLVGFFGADWNDLDGPAALCLETADAGQTLRQALAAVGADTSTQRAYLVSAAGVGLELVNGQWARQVLKPAQEPAAAPAVLEDDPKTGPAQHTTTADPGRRRGPVLPAQTTNGCHDTYQSLLEGDEWRAAARRARDDVAGELGLRFRYLEASQPVVAALRALAQGYIQHQFDNDEEVVVENWGKRRGILPPLAEDDDADPLADWRDWIKAACAGDLLLLLAEATLDQVVTAYNARTSRAALLQLIGKTWDDVVADYREAQGALQAQEVGG